MSQPDTLSDSEFLRRFLATVLAPADFDHRGHLRAAWLVLRHHDVEEAVGYTCAGIARLATKFGVPGKYHHTLSEALVRLMAYERADSQARSLDEFLRARPAFASDVAGLLGRYYSAECLGSDDARARFVPPDREPLPA